MGHPAISPDQILVFLVDDHQMWRHLLRLQLDLEPDLHVVGEAATGGEAVDAVAELAPDLVLLDLDLGGRNGLTYVGALHEAAPSARILVLSGTEKVEDMVEAFRAGASGSCPSSTRSRSSRLRCAPCTQASRCCRPRRQARCSARSARSPSRSSRRRSPPQACRPASSRCSTCSLGR